MVRAVRPGTPRARDPYGIGPAGSMVAPLLSVVGLVLIGIITFNLINGEAPFGAGGGTGDGNGDPTRTAAPSNVVVVPEEATFEGSITYAKGGNIWVQTAETVTQITDTGGASMPSWSSDGGSIVYVHYSDARGYWPICRNGGCKNGRYDIQIPDLMQVRADGSAEPERLVTGTVKDGELEWAAWMRQPVLSPSGKTIALVTDAPNPEESNVVLQFFDVGDQEAAPRGGAGVGCAWTPGPRVAARRPAPPVHPERP